VENVGDEEANKSDTLLTALKKMGTVQRLLKQPAGLIDIN
jgi:hypothetical protein